MRLVNVSLSRHYATSVIALTFVFLLCLMILPTHAAVITEYSLDGDPRPYGITTDSSGNVWFTEFLKSRIGKLSGSQIVEYDLPDDLAHPYDIVYDPDGSDPNGNSIWFTESDANMIGRLKGSVLVEFQLTGGTPTGITFDYNASGSNKNVWFTERTGDKIGKIFYDDTDGEEGWVTVEYTVPADAEGPLDIARSPVDGLLYFCAFDDGNIASFNPWNGVFKVYYVNSELSSPGSFGLRSIAVGSDGIVWATVDYDTSTVYDLIMRLDPWSRDVVTYQIPDEGSNPRGVTVDDDKNVWFTEYDKDKIGRLNPITGYITEYNLPSTSSRPFDVTVDDNIVWFTEELGDKVGRLDPTTGTSFTTVNTITSATSGSATVTTNKDGPLVSAATTLYSTDTHAPPKAAFTTLTTTVNFATSTVTTKTETVYVLPTTMTASTTSTYTSALSATTTVSAILTSAVSTDVSSTTTTTSQTFTTPIATETTYTTRGIIYTDIVATTTQTNFAATSYRYTTITVPTYTQYTTSTIKQTTTETVSTTTTTATVYSTSTEISASTTTGSATRPFGGVIPGFSLGSIIACIGMMAACPVIMRRMCTSRRGEQ